jgi:hypothetical protein
VRQTQQVTLYIRRKGRRSLVPPLSGRELSLDEFVEQSMFKFILPEVRDAALITLQAMSGGSLSPINTQRAKLKFIPRDLHLFMLQHIHKPQDPHFPAFCSLFTKVLKRLFSWVRLRAIIRPTTIWEFIRWVSDYNHLQRSSYLKLENISF